MMDYLAAQRQFVSNMSAQVTMRNHNHSYCADRLRAFVVEHEAFLDEVEARLEELSNDEYVMTTYRPLRAMVDEALAALAEYDAPRQLAMEV